MLVVESSAPSNIAIIKYMGKESSGDNTPTNSSLSWTLDELRSYVRITSREDLNEDQWAPLGNYPVYLSPKSVSRFLTHFQNLKKEWQINQYFLIESGNNYPSDCGLASSASSFAALTKAAGKMFQQILPRPEIGTAEMAEFSRRGSGSSCRSFFGPWTLWYKDGVRPLELAMASLRHQVVIVEDEKKEVSSSLAHERVTSSYLFQGRSERAERRLAEVIYALEMQNWKSFYELAWAEFWDMQALFETAMPAFGYLKPSSLQVLETVRHFWREHEDGPVVTMDAGPNVHFLWRLDQVELVRKLADRLKQYRFFSDEHLRGILGS